MNRNRASNKTYNIMSTIKMKLNKESKLIIRFTTNNKEDIIKQPLEEVSVTIQE